jgi:hypothetical protein
VSYSSEVLADSPIGYWRLGDASGLTAVDSSGNSHDGTYTNGPTLAQPGLLLGDADTAVSFDGSNDYVDLTNNAAFRVSTAWTLEAWIKIASGETISGTIMTNQYDGGTVRWTLDCFDGTNHGLKPAVLFYNGGWMKAQSASDISVNAVHHLVGTWNGTTLKIYVDGSLAASNAPGISVATTNTSTNYIGSRWDNSGDGQKFKGIIDEVAIYGTDIGATRIAAHYAAGTTNPNGTATPSAVAGTGAVPAPTVSGQAHATPGVTAGTGAVPAAAVKNVPPNDNVANAEVLSAVSGSFGPYTIDDATTEAGEPDIGGSSNNSIWFKFTAAGTGTVHLSTFGSLAGDAPSGDGLPHGAYGSLDTVMAIWTGTTPTSLYSNNDDSATDPENGYWSELSIGVSAGVTYWIQVGTFDASYVGTVMLNWSGLVLPASPSATAGTGAVPAPTVVANGVASPGTVVGIGAVPSPPAFGDVGTAHPVSVAGVGLVPSSTAKGGSIASPAGVIGIGAVPSSSLTGTAAAQPAAVAGAGGVPHPHAVGQGTGGGGGSVDGVTDFWAVKALG